MPVAFVIDGGERVIYEKSRNMDDVLARFLGKGTVVYGPVPEYPRTVPWTAKRGSGVYELRVNARGAVDEVKVLVSSGDGTFDLVAVQTLRKWRLRRGPVTLELPLSFTLTPTRFAVQLPKHDAVQHRGAR